MVAALEGIPALSVDIQAGAAGNQKPQTVAVAVILAFNPPLPLVILVQLIKNQGSLFRRPTGRQDLPAVIPIVPVIITVRLFI